MMRKIFIILILTSAVALHAQQKRDKTTFNAHIEAVDEYVPAPGQFVNTMPEYESGDTKETMASKCTSIMIANSTGDEDNQGLICLGAYGGYLTFHFDHSVANVEGQNDLKIQGNAFAEVGNTLGGSSEPGIIMVSKDVNHNWLPDDPWYELSGSADVDSIGKVVYNYEITYTRKPMENIPWTDNQGQSGEVLRTTFHKQEYYPLWIDASTLTYQGTLLPPSGKKSSSGYIQLFYRYGYVDNRPDDDGFDISRAVDADRQPANLDFIDFVRVYCATNQQYPLIGETSTEIKIAEDLHLSESLTRIQQATGIHDVKVDVNADASFYNLQGCKVAIPLRGLYIRNGKKYIIK
jgi:hypothetical protein